MNDRATEAAGVWDRPQRALTAGILLAIAAFAGDGMGVVPALPTAVRDVGGMALFGWAFSAFMLAWIVGTIAGGLVADARGPRAPMAAGLLAFGAGLVLAAAARGMLQLLAGRALQGAGGGAMVAAAYVAMARGYPDHVRPRMMALSASTWVIPAVVGPALSGAVAQWVGWRWVFLGILPLLAVTAVVVLPPLGRFAVRRPAADLARLSAAARLAVGAGLVLAAPSLSRWWAAAALAAGTLLAVPALRALLPAGTVRARAGLPAGLAARALLAFSFFGTEAFIPLGAGSLRGATPARAGLALTAGALGWIAASWAQDRIEQRHGAGGRTRRIVIGFAIMAVGIALVAATLLTMLPPALGLLGWATGGAGIGLAYAAGGLVCIAAAPDERQGEVSGQLQLAEALGTSAGAGLGGALLAWMEAAGYGTRLGLAAIFAITWVGALVGGLAARRATAVPLAAATERSPTAPTVRSPSPSAD
jgi:MFS family permease